MGIRGGYFFCSQDIMMATGEVQPLPVPGKNTAASFPPPILHRYETGMYLASSLKAFLITLALKMTLFC